MTQVIDEQGRLQMPPNYQPGETVDIEIGEENELLIRKAQPAVGKVELVELPNGFTVIRGLPPIDSEGVKRLLEDFP